MLKMLGAVLVIAAATMAGWLQARQYANRPNQIRKLILALRRLQTEIMYGFTPLPDALVRIGEQSGEPIKSIFHGAAKNMNPPWNRTAQDSLQTAIEEGWRFTAMKAAEKDVLKGLSFNLGTSDRKDQLSHIMAAVHQLESEEACAREEQNRYEKMFKSLGLLCGAFIVILFY
ncbi:stage III sporulation protein SpoIIIAB [Paenibacillus sp. M1]|uniref:Stage III sporulation protein SpoIIIAB n=1 Tax=Paenibacillus haidiansis TaxID=1574488 RepID=A0ABU7VL25_9BACL